jgi:hypothetical protein
VRLFILKWTPVVFGIGCALLQVGILAAMKRKKLRQQFPVFFSYNIYVIAAVVISFVPYFLCCSPGGIPAHPSLYYVYYALSLILIGFEFALMYEIFVAALKPYSALIDLGKMLFRWAGLFLLIAAALTAFATASPAVNRLPIAIQLLERSMRLMECGLLLLFLLFERKLGLSWRSPSMSIAIGLGTTAASGLTIAFLENRFPEASVVLGVIENLCYFGAVIFWYACLTLPVLERKNVLDSPSRLIFQRWNEALLSYTTPRGELSLAPSSMDSFLPGVEQTVDRVLARKMVQ